MTASTGRKVEVEELEGKLEKVSILNASPWAIR